MNPQLNGTQAALDSEKPFLVLCTDKHRFGQPLRALRKDGRHIEKETWDSRFLRFASKEEAESWMRDNSWALDRRNWTYTITTV